MLFTSAQFDKIKEMSVYKDSFDNYEDFNNHIDDKLGTDNVVIFVSNILNIMSIYNTGKIDNKSNDTLEIKELIIKANMSQNKDVLLHLLGKLNSKDKRIISIDKIIDKELLDKTEKKLDYLIYLEQICKEFYPNFDDKIVLSKFHKKMQDDTIRNFKKFVPVIIVVVAGVFLIINNNPDEAPEKSKVIINKKNDVNSSKDSNITSKDSKKSSNALADSNESHQTEQTDNLKDSNTSKVIIDKNDLNSSEDSNITSKDSKKSSNALADSNESQ